MAETWDEPVVNTEVPEIKLFGKWSSEDVQVSDISLTVSISPSVHFQNVSHKNLEEYNDFSNSVILKFTISYVKTKCKRVVIFGARAKTICIDMWVAVSAFQLPQS